MIQLRGKKTGAIECIIPEDAAVQELTDNFKQIMAGDKQLFAGSSVEVDFGNRMLDFDTLKTVLENFIVPGQITVSRWICANEESLNFMHRLGFYSVREACEASQEVCAPLVIFGNVRGGQHIEHNGDVIITGNVNRDSEVAAEGNIIVFGRLGGIAHAGCCGNGAMCVAVGSIETGQVRIGSKLAVINADSNIWGKAATVRIENEEIRVLLWPDL